MRGRARPLPPALFLAATVLLVALHFSLPIRRILTFPWNLIGLLPVIAGLALNFCAGWSFNRRGTAIKPFEKSSALVTTGVFRITRNPMYLGLSLMLLGIALQLGSCAPFAVVVAFPILIDRLFIVHEEEMMEDTFGDRFRECRARVRRWI